MSLATTTVARPRYEGANIRTWIGFKHFVYLVEEAVLDWFRGQGLGPRRLYHESGLGLEILDCSVQMPAVLDVDDVVSCEAVPSAPGRFTVLLRVSRDGVDVVVARAKVSVGLVREKDAPGDAAPPAPVAELVVPDVAAATGTPDVLELPPGVDPAVALAGAFVWPWKARYFHCHYSDRVQHSAYVRALEEVVDRFLADRGISVGRMLAERGWIPVVSRARVRLLADARMEETVFTTFRVDDVLKNLTYDGQSDSWVERDGRLLRVATARILHGYAVSRGPRAGQLAELDDEVVALLCGGAGE
jgi:acyl-CoA thioesterase FadM